MGECRGEHVRNVAIEARVWMDMEYGFRKDFTVPLPSPTRLRYALLLADIVMPSLFSSQLELLGDGVCRDLRRKILCLN
jgi:hypothetical protein